MSASKLPLVAIWRNALRDSNLDRTAKLVGLVLSTYMDSAGVAWPSKATLAAKASLGSGRRAVDMAIDRLEAAGLLEIERSRGRRPFVYHAAGATLTAHAPRGSTPHETTPTSHISRSTSHPGATESDTESEESETPRGRRGSGLARGAKVDLSYLDEVGRHG